MDTEEEQIMCVCVCEASRKMAEAVNVCKLVFIY